MIPLQLTLKNFLSYREANLDFRGLHTACICGANGAGKSSLLEAITWAIWGQSRAASDDDVIHIGSENVRVDFQFISNDQTYRIIRTRQRGRVSSLDFQVESSAGFRSLSSKGLRGTQEQIISSLKLDYDTFINSAYLRQGRADEFMLRRPNERKQILADLLKLDQYEELAQRAKDISKQLKGQAEELENSLKSLEEQLGKKAEFTDNLTQLKSKLNQLKIAQEKDLKELRKLQAEEHQHQSWHQQFTWQQNQYQSLLEDVGRSQKEKTDLELQIKELEKILQQESEIITGCNHLINLQKQEETLANKFQSYQESQQKKQHLEQKFSQQINEINLQIRQTQTNLESLQNQEEELKQILRNSPEVQAGLQQLRHYRQRLKELDQLQQKVSPLLQRRYIIQTEIERTEAKLNAKLEQLLASEVQYSSEKAQIPQIRQAALAVDAKIKELDKKQVYRKRIEEKGTEKKSLKERLEEQEKIYTRQIDELQKKLEMLENPQVNCPLCEQELDEHHRHQVIQKTQSQQQQIQEQIWRLEEQMLTSEKELQALRAEYRQLSEELTEYDSLQQQLANREAKLEAMGEIHIKLQQIKAEIALIEQSLSSNQYAQELQTELQLINQELQNLNYDEQTHAIVRGEVERWRWAEIKQAKIEEASRRQGKINTEKPQLLEKINRLKTEINQLQTNSQIKQKINQLEAFITKLGYEQSHHNSILANLRQARSWQLRYQELEQAKQQYPQRKILLQELETRLQVRLQDRATLQEELAKLSVQMEGFTDSQKELQSLDQQVQERRQKMDELLGERGRIEQTLNQLASWQSQAENTRQKLQEINRQYRIHQELVQAFGKNGIQALMIENILPQLEAETNQILARLTGNQLHVQFLTQKAGRSSNSKRKSAKLIDTLEILIADARGTRPYETYSGGEAFRINFSIRLALARLLAQRAGTSLQMLIVDEGFGTQDAEGCDRLIAAINAITPDFACILTVTHMPQFKEAFQHRIEVFKTNQGSQLKLLA
jgi:exonuclease SbcC